MSREAKRLKVLVGLSGGVDSAVSASLLKRAGADVVGAFIKTWQPDWLANSCSWKTERRDAMRISAHLNIPFITIDLENEYKKSVVDYMIGEYRAGRTPNPDVMCNKEIKFGAFLDKAISLGADAIATGHYAQIGRKLKVEDKRLELWKGSDMGKDQSYFLWTLNQAQLAHTIFPVGHLKKSEVREIAKRFKLPVAEKRDSQGICFLGQVDMREFLSHYIKSRPGRVLDTEGQTIGSHGGAIFYTIGQAWQRPNYVVAKDVAKNTITVSDKLIKNLSQLDIGDYISKVIKLENVNWISGTAPNLGLNTYKLAATTRYHGEKLKCTIKHFKLNSCGVIFHQPTIVAPGQSVVIYNRDVCLGGGIVM